MVNGSGEDSNITIGSGSSYKMGPEVTASASAYNRDSITRNNDTSNKVQSSIEDKDSKDRFSKHFKKDEGLS